MKAAALMLWPCAMGETSPFGGSLGRDHNLVISVMPPILFDTSGLNELAKDCESQALMAGLSSGYHVLLSETNINEIGATSNVEKRTLFASTLPAADPHRQRDPIVPVDSKRNGEPSLGRPGKLRLEESGCSVPGTGRGDRP